MENEKVNTPVENTEKVENNSIETTQKKEVEKTSKEEYFYNSRQLDKREAEIAKREREFNFKQNTSDFKSLFEKSGGKPKYFNQVVKFKQKEISNGTFDEKSIKEWKKELDWAFETNTISHLSTNPQISKDNNIINRNPKPKKDMSINDYIKEFSK